MKSKLIDPDKLVVGKILPSDVEAEKAVLGAILLDGYVVPVAMELLDMEAFYEIRNGKIFDAMVSLFQKNVGIDVITLREELRRLRMLEDVGGFGYLNELVSGVVSSANIESHCQIVAETALARRLINFMATTIQECFDRRNDTIELVRRSIDEIYSLTFGKWQRKEVSASKAIDLLAKELDIDNYFDKPPMGLQTRIYELNDMIGGIEPGFYLITGNTSVGKTSFCVYLARTLAEDVKKTVDYITLEKSAVSYIQRIACQIGDVQPRKLRRRELEKFQLAGFKRAMEKTRTLPLLIHDPARMTVTELRAHVKRTKATSDLGVVFIDYIQKIRDPQSRGLEDRMTNLSGEITGLAKEVNVPIIGISALSNEGNIRGSNMIGYDCDVHINLENQNPGKGDLTDRSVATIKATIKKARDGKAQGHFMLKLMPSTNIVPSTREQRQEELRLENHKIATEIADWEESKKKRDPLPW